MSEHVYTGPEELVYTAHLAVAPDGTLSTLVGTPGGPSVTVLGDPPGDGRWAPVTDEPQPQPQPDAADKPAKTSKGATS